MDDGGIVRLLLVALTVRVDQQGNQTAEDGAAEPHGDHVEEVEVWKKRERRTERDEREAGGDSLSIHTSGSGNSICNSYGNDRVFCNKKDPSGLLRKIKNTCLFFFQSCSYFHLTLSFLLFVVCYHRSKFWNRSKTSLIQNLCPVCIWYKCTIWL